MTTSTGLRAAIVFNPIKIDAKRLRSAVAAEEETNGWLPSAWFETTPDDPGEAAARAALAGDPALVIIAGGDGTIRAVAEVLQSTETPVALVPAGTGNLLARNLGLMADIETSVRTAFTGAVHAIDVGFVELEYPASPASSHTLLVMSGVGLDAKMATDTSDVLKKRIGWLAYVHPIGRSILRNKQFLLRYRVDGSRERTVRAHTVIVGNCGALTAGMVLLPDAKPDDGLLDVVMLRPKGFWQWLRVGFRLGVTGVLHRSKAGRVALRSAPDLRALQYLQARNVTARFDRPQSIELDGDSFGEVTAVTITIRPGALKVRVPNPT